METTIVDVCWDCNAIATAAHADMPDGFDPTETWEALRTRWGSDVTLEYVSDGPEPFFSWYPCVGCYSWLGGDRFAVALTYRPVG